MQFKDLTQNGGTTAYGKVGKGQNQMAAVQHRLKSPKRQKYKIQ